MKVNQVLRTNDYTLFHLLNENRDVNRLHVERIKKNMQRKLMPSVIVVNEDFEIIDGQHNYTARKELKLPIDYMICVGLKGEDIPFFNVERSNWKASDYMALYCKLGYKDYCQYARFYNFYGLGHNVTMQLCFGSNNDDIRKKFYNGISKINKVENAELIASILNDYLPYTNLVTKTTIVTKLKDIILNEWYDHEWMIGRMKVKKNEFANVKVNDGLRFLEEVYNYRKRGELVRFF